ncbi:CCA tRNA nucleotidyltransferase [Stomatohabitans albus]|uniref:CCA tRNA nucleotidyltransferase n=1 Tax=Stomatohabitans albus TaxID=3110766 RepID=UPI00300D83F0
MPQSLPFSTPIPALAIELGEAFEHAGHELVLVGGSVRDLILGKEDIPDLDFATDAHPEETTRILNRLTTTIWDTGARFGTISAQMSDSAGEVYIVEVTTYRSEAYTAGDRHPDVEFGDDINADLSRRDFTVNAIGIRVPSGELVDPFDGVADMKRQVLRTPARPVVSFADDPLRMMRLARFVGVLGFQADSEAIEAATAMASQIETISAERVRIELDKLICGDYADRGLDLLCEVGIADVVLPELPALRMEHDPLHHHKDVYTHTLAVVMGCPGDDPILRMAALLHDIGKPATRAFHEDGSVSFHQHDIVGARMARHRLRALTYPNQAIREISELVRLHLRFHGYSDGEWTDSAVRRYVADCGSEIQYRRLNLLTRADVTTRNKRKANRFARAMDDLEARVERLREQEALDAVRPALDGGQIMAYLGLKPGREVGAIWNWLKDQALEYGPMSFDQAYGLLDEYAAAHGFTVVGERIDPKPPKEPKEPRS